MNSDFITLRIITLRETELAITWKEMRSKTKVAQTVRIELKEVS